MVIIMYLLLECKISFSLGRRLVYACEASVGKARCVRCSHAGIPSERNRFSWSSSKDCECEG